jgi:hypothetical protein
VALEIAREDVARILPAWIAIAPWAPLSVPIPRVGV